MLILPNAKVTDSNQSDCIAVTTDPDCYRLKSMTLVFGNMGTFTAMRTGRRGMAAMLRTEVSVSVGRRMYITQNHSNYLDAQMGSQLAPAVNVRVKGQRRVCIDGASSERSCRRRRASGGNEVVYHRLALVASPRSSPSSLSLGVFIISVCSSAWCN